MMQPGSHYALGKIKSVVSPEGAFYVASVDVIGKSNAAWRKIAGFSDHVKDVAVNGDGLYLLTFKDAPRYKVIHCDINDPNLSTAKVVVALAKL